jgi:hypothetical protein
MRVIVNLQSDRAAGAAGWRARAVQIDSKNEACLEEVLKAIAIGDGTSMYDIIINNDILRNDWILMVNGIRMPSFCLEVNVKDNVQIHLIDKHR